MLFSLLVVAAAASQVVADLTCKTYIPKNRTSSSSTVYLYTGTEQGSIFDRPNLLPTYAGVGNPWKLKAKGSSGAKFNLKTCNSTSLGRSAFTQSSCSHGGCYISYTDYIQIINPSTGHCLTAINWNASATSLDFETCKSNLANTAQLWSANQYVNYAPNYASITGYGPVTLDPVQRGSAEEIDYPYFAWYVSKADNKTLQVIHFDYTQKGLFMNLNPA